MSDSLQIRELGNNKKVESAVMKFLCVTIIATKTCAASSCRWAVREKVNSIYVIVSTASAFPGFVPLSDRLFVDGNRVLRFIFVKRPQTTPNLHIMDKKLKTIS